MKNLISLTALFSLFVVLIVSTGYPIDVAHSPPIADVEMVAAIEPEISVAIATVPGEWDYVYAITKPHAVNNDHTINLSFTTGGDMFAGWHYLKAETRNSFYKTLQTSEYDRNSHKQTELFIEPYINGNIDYLLLC